jgi:DNA-binding transcriptional regulator YdaS (Cro superfamily)
VAKIRRTVQLAAELLGGPEKLADRICVSQPMVRAWISGSVRPSDNQFFQIVDFLGETGHGSTE